MWWALTKQFYCRIVIEKWAVQSSQRARILPDSHGSSWWQRAVWASWTISLFSSASGFCSYVMQNLFPNSMCKSLPCARASFHPCLPCCSGCHFKAQGKTHCLFLCNVFIAPDVDSGFFPQGVPSPMASYALMAWDLEIICSNHLFFY